MGVEAGEAEQEGMAGLGDSEELVEYEEIIKYGSLILQWPITRVTRHPNLPDGSNLCSLLWHLFSSTLPSAL